MVRHPGLAAALQLKGGEGIVFLQPGESWKCGGGPWARVTAVEGGITPLGGQDVCLSRGGAVRTVLAGGQGGAGCETGLGARCLPAFTSPWHRAHS